MATSVHVRKTAKDAKKEANITAEDEDGWKAFEVRGTTAVSCTIFR